MRTLVPSRPTATLAVVFGGNGGGVHRNLKKEEVDAARAAALEEGDHTLRLLIDTLWFTGARISEALLIEVRDIDFGETQAGEQYFVAVPTLKKRPKKPKKGKPPPPAPAVLPRRGVPVPAAFVVPLSLYVNTHHLKAEDRLFSWRRTKAFGELKRILLKVGVDKERARPHAFRHGHAMHALRNGVPINIVQETLGHASIFTTQVYVKACGTDIAKSYKNVRW